MHGFRSWKGHDGDAQSSPLDSSEMFLCLAHPKPEMGKLRPRGHVRPEGLFDPAHRASTIVFLSLST